MNVASAAAADAFLIRVGLNHTHFRATLRDGFFTWRPSLVVASATVHTTPPPAHEHKQNPLESQKARVLK